MAPFTPLPSQPPPPTPSFTQFSATTGAVLNTYTGVPAVPQGITFGPDGNLYATTAVEPNSQLNQIVQFNPATGSTVTLVSSSLLNVPQGITVGPDGNFYVANLGNNRILRITPTGTITNLGATGLARPTGLIFDHNTLFVSNNSGGITAYNGSVTGGTFTLGSGAPAFSIAGGGAINGPEGLTVGPNGNIYFANDDSAAGDGTTSNIDMLAVTRDVVTGAPISFGAVSVFATEDAALGASFVLFAVPEPSTYVIFGIASLVMTFFGIRRRVA